MSMLKKKDLVIKWINFLINDELHLYVVCDGMGGHAGGEIANSFGSFGNVLRNLGGMFLELGDQYKNVKNIHYLTN